MPVAAESALKSIAHSSPVFVMGAPCSNTSLLATALTAGDEFWCSGELHLMYELLGPGEGGDSKLYESFREASRDESFWLSKNRVVYPEFAAYLGHGLDRLISSRAGNKRWVDASIDNTWIAADVALFLPKAKFINVIRDGREVVSKLIEQEGPKVEAGSFEKACETWNAYAERALKFRETQFPNYFELRHEALSEIAPSIARRLVGFLDARKPAPIADFLTMHLGEIQASHENDWSEIQEETFAKIAGDSMKRLGYMERA